jgi:hypothetical protein
MSCTLHRIRDKQAAGDASKISKTMAAGELTNTIKGGRQ